MEDSQLLFTIHQTEIGGINNDQLVQKVCPVCGNKFIPTNGQLCCSQVCINKNSGHFLNEDAPIEKGK